MSGACYEYGIQTPANNLAIGVCPDQVQTGDRAEMTQQPGFDVFGHQGLTQ
jgi:hypothetical protein